MRQARDGVEYRVLAAFGDTGRHYATEAEAVADAEGLGLTAEGQPIGGVALVIRSGTEVSRQLVWPRVGQSVARHE